MKRSCRFLRTSRSSMRSTQPTQPNHGHTAPAHLVTCLSAAQVDITSAAMLKMIHIRSSALNMIVASNPSVIILGDSLWGVTPESVAGTPGLGNHPRGTKQSDFPFDDNLVSRPGPRLVDGLEQIAKLLRPGLLE